MNGPIGSPSTLTHTTLNRPRPNRTRKPSYTRTTSTTSDDDPLNTFFPQVSPGGPHNAEDDAPHHHHQSQDDHQLHRLDISPAEIATFLRSSPSGPSPLGSPMSPIQQWEDRESTFEGHILESPLFNFNKHFDFSRSNKNLILSSTSTCDDVDDSQSDRSSITVDSLLTVGSPEVFQGEGVCESPPSENYSVTSTQCDGKTDEQTTTADAGYTSTTYDESIYETIFSDEVIMTKLTCNDNSSAHLDSTNFKETPTVSNTKEYLIQDKTPNAINDVNAVYVQADKPKPPPKPVRRRNATRKSPPSSFICKLSNYDQDSEQTLEYQAPRNNTSIQEFGSEREEKAVVSISSSTLANSPKKKEAMKENENTITLSVPLNENNVQSEKSIGRTSSPVTNVNKQDSEARKAPTNNQYNNSTEDDTRNSNVAMASEAVNECGTDGPIYAEVNRTVKGIRQKLRARAKSRASIKVSFKELTSRSGARKELCQGGEGAELPPIPPKVVHRNKPAKPPRKHIEASDNLEKDQDPCPDHQAILNFYCIKCRVVICRDCTVVAHQHSDSHKVLDTPDALSTLRTQAVSLLRHYTLLNSLHASLTRVHQIYSIMNPSMEPTPLSARLKEGEILAKVVREAEAVVDYGRNLRKIHERVIEWEMGQHEWGDIVFLASRCHLLANITAPSDKVFIRLSDWIMPTPWIHLSHLLQPYLGDPPSKTSNRLSPAVQRKGRSRSPSRVSLGYGATDLPFPYNAREVVMSSLLPYIILNPDTRYFISVSGPGDLDVTLVVISMDEHAREYLKRRYNNATKSPGALRFRPSEDALTIVERQLMMGGQHRSRLIASYKASGATGSTATQLVVKVSLPDVKLVEEGHGLPAVKGGVKKGHLIVDYDAKGKPTLSVVARDIGDVPALLLGQVTHGLDGLVYQVEAEDNKRAENSGFRAKLLSSVRREEEALYDITFGMDL